MARLSQRDERRADEVIAALGEHPSGARGAIDQALPMLRELLGVEVACAYRACSLGGGAYAADFVQFSGLRQPEVEAGKKVDRLLRRASARGGIFDPVHPQRHQQNRAHLLPFHGLERASDAGDVGEVISPFLSHLFLAPGGPAETAQSVWDMENVLRAVGLRGRDQVRALLCDEGTLLAWLGGFPAERATERQRLLLRRVLQPLRARLIAERRAEGGELEHAATGAALEHIPAAAFVLDESSRVRHANAVGRHRLTVEGCALRQTLERAVKEQRAVPEFAVTKLAGAGLGATFLAISTARGERVRCGIERAKARWQLTAREAEVLSELAAGRGNRDIADRLGAAPRTVELHISSILQKAHADSRSQVIIDLWHLTGAS